MASFFMLLILSLLKALHADFVHENFPATVIEDGKLDTPHLILRHKYPVETHFVTTADDYILQMHRMPKPGGLPVLLMHGLLDSSSTWVIMGPWSGLGFYLYDHGYDVWMGNARGNRYSRNHTTLDPSSSKTFWKFSWHEIGFYDLPKMIDYVLEKTQHKKLTYFGHSQGTTAFFVMCSTRPSYNAKISSMQALAPVAFLKHIKTPLLPLAPTLLNLFGTSPEFLPHSKIFSKYCFLSKMTVETCIEFINQLMGKDPKGMNLTMSPTILGHVPAGAAFRQVLHYYQLVGTDRFCRFDYGPVENMRFYRSIKPPEYPIENIKAPVALHYTYNDYLTSDVDVQRLSRLLPNVIANNLLPYREWNHITVVWGINARELLHKRIIEIMKRF